METGKSLVDHWSWAAEKGVMNRNTAAGLRAACVQVLSVLEEGENDDIAKLDVEALLTRFQNLRKQRFKPQVLETYKRRFRKAVSSYLEYLENPGGWKPTNQERFTAQDRARRASIGRPQTAPGGGATAIRVVAVGEVEYPFPLRPGVMARLILPVDLTSDEVTRIQNFVAMLVVDAGKSGEVAKSD
jgi:hypothetical protein